MNTTHEQHVQDLVSTLTDAVIRHDGTLDQIMGRYDLNDDDVANWLPIIDSLHNTLVEVQPRPAFKRQLRNELLKRPIGVRVRLRPLPTRVQLAAVLTIVGGFVLIVYNWFMGNMRKVALNPDDEPAVLH